MRLLRKKYNSPKQELSGKAEQLLLAYSWPGNVRELKNLLERAFIYAEGDTIESASLSFEEPEELRGRGTLKSAVEEFEREMIIRRLAECKGNRTQTAQSLDISIRNLQYKLEKYDIGN